jgi:hypothetical protein
MVLTLGIGSKCAFILPQNFINPHITPAQGLIINRFINTKSLILVEEVWQFKGLFSDKKEAITPSGNIRASKWGWQSIPEITKKSDEYLMVEVLPHNIMVPSQSTLDAIINKAIEDFFKLEKYNGKEEQEDNSIRKPPLR